ncbi:hypothetical protein MTO96_029596 [Rhipicephalus appendiculatus]
MRGLAAEPLRRPLNPEFCGHGNCSMVDVLGLRVLVGRSLSAPVCIQRQGLARPRDRRLARSSRGGTGESRCAKR